MQQHGGKFVQSLATALRYADPLNRQKILDSFPDLVLKYGPTSMFNAPIRQPMEVL
jgi:hypothetical protein